MAGSSEPICLFYGACATFSPLWTCRIQHASAPGLDGEIYQLGSVNYDAAMTELLLHGFAVGGTGDFFPPVPADKVAVGFLVGDSNATTGERGDAIPDHGEAPEGVTYRLQRPDGYPEMIGAMSGRLTGSN